MLVVMYLQCEAWPLSSIPMYAFEIKGLDADCRFESPEAFFQHVHFCTQHGGLLCVPFCAVEIQVATAGPAQASLPHTVATNALARFVEPPPASFSKLHRAQVPWAAGDQGTVLMIHCLTQFLTKVSDTAVSQNWFHASAQEQRLAMGLGDNGSFGSAGQPKELNSRSSPPGWRYGWLFAVATMVRPLAPAVRRGCISALCHASRPATIRQCSRPQMQSA